MKTCFPGRRAHLSCLALTLSAVLLCGFLAGCGGKKDSSMGRGDGEQPNTVAEEVDPVTLIPEPVSMLDTGEGLVSLTRFIQNLPDGPESEKEIRDAIAELKAVAAQLEPLLETGSAGTMDPLKTLESRIKDLLDRIQPPEGNEEQERDEAQESFRQTLRTNLSVSLIAAAELRSRLEGKSESASVPDQQGQLADEIQALRNGNAELKDTMDRTRKSLEKLQDIVESGRKFLGLGMIFGVIFAGIGAAAAVALAVKAFFFPVNIDQSEKFQEVQKDLKDLKTMISAETDEARTQKESRQKEFDSEVQKIRDAVAEEIKKARDFGGAQSSAVGSSSAGRTTPLAQNNVPPVIKYFKTDPYKKTSGLGSDIILKDAYLREEFSGIQVPGTTDIFYIWPDPWGLGFVPNEGAGLKDVQSNKLYHGYVSKCFTIDPNQPANSLSFQLTLVQYAKIQKVSGGYKLITPGTVKARPTS